MPTYSPRVRTCGDGLYGENLHLRRADIPRDMEKIFLLISHRRLMAGNGTNASKSAKSHHDGSEREIICGWRER